MSGVEVLTVIGISCGILSSVGFTAFLKNKLSNNKNFRKRYKLFKELLKQEFKKLYQMSEKTYEYYKDDIKKIATELANEYINEGLDVIKESIDLIINGVKYRNNNKSIRQTYDYIKQGFIMRETAFQNRKGEEINSINNLKSNINPNSKRKNQNILYIVNDIHEVISRSNYKHPTHDEDKIFLQKMELEGLTYIDNTIQERQELSKKHDEVQEKIVSLGVKRKLPRIARKSFRHKEQEMVEEEKEEEIYPDLKTKNHIIAY
jgi:hypothetical protein